MMNLWVFFSVACVFAKGHKVMNANEYVQFAADAGDSVFAVMFHVDWCGACKRTLPEFAKVKIDGVDLISVDITDSSDRFDIKAYPDLRVVSPGHKSVSIPYYYRDSVGISNFINRVRSPAWTEYAESLVERPPFGWVQSVVFFGDDFPDSVFELWKSRIQFIKTDRWEDISDEC